MSTAAAAAEPKHLADWRATAAVSRRSVGRMQALQAATVAGLSTRQEKGHLVQKASTPAAALPSATWLEKERPVPRHWPSEAKWTALAGRLLGSSKHL